MLSQEPVLRLSRQTAFTPLSRRRSHRCDPMKPAPPVMRAVRDERFAKRDGFLITRLSYIRWTSYLEWSNGAEPVHSTGLLPKDVSGTLDGFDALLAVWTWTQFPPQVADVAFYQAGVVDSLVAPDLVCDVAVREQLTGVKR